MKTKGNSHKPRQIIEMEMPESRDCVNLRPKDVIGAVLHGDRSVEDYSNLELQRWLECHGLKKCRNKAELVQRVINCFNAGRDNTIFMGVNGGKLYDAKRNLMLNAGGSSTSSEIALIFLKWENFPSQGIFILYSRIVFDDNVSQFTIV